ncbi:SSI family serine proteinase inhibitor [Streptomyces sp. NPDC058417]|uniref:SSI family serine proteinase inhibitor n=1 Tax=unclassified Streptomyces TaxID=2593676 RepID=UPI003661A421
MKHTPLRRLLGALPAAAALLAAVVPAHAAAPLPGDLFPGGGLQLTVTRGDARSSDSRGTLLLCDPPQGHARAAEACADLTAAGGDIDAIPPRKAICSMLHAPVTARATGQWHGRPVSWTRTFSNLCVLHAQTGALFALDETEVPELAELPDFPML